LRTRANPLKSIALAGIRAGLHWPDAQLEVTKEYFFLKQVLDKGEVNCVLDVGANRGQFASILRKIGYGGQIISFEPSLHDFKNTEAKILK
jgi:hypothetical protein